MATVASDTGGHTHLVIPTRYRQDVSGDRPAGMPHHIIKGTENLQGESNRLAGWLLLLGGKICSKVGGRRGKRKGRKQEAIALEPLANAFITTTK